MARQRHQAVEVQSQDPVAKTPGSFVALAGYFLLIFLVFAGGAYAISLISSELDDLNRADRQVLLLPILLVYGVVTLVIALGALVAILAHFRLSAPNSALGLPEGSVQAVIALVLVLIFAITAVFVLTLEISETDRITERLATQVLTTTGTLAVAVAGFYFGTRAVEAGSQAAATAVQTAGAVGAGSSVRVATPASPATLAKDPGTKLSIDIATVPEDAHVTWSLSGDDAGEVVQLGPTKFEYRRGPSAEDEVLIKFQLTRDPTATADLTVHPPPGGEAPPGVQQAPPPGGEAPPGFESPRGPPPADADE